MATCAAVHSLNAFHLVLSRVGSFLQSTFHPLSPPPKRRPRSEMYNGESSAAATVGKGD